MTSLFIFFLHKQICEDDWALVGSFKNMIMIISLYWWYRPIQRLDLKSLKCCLVSMLQVNAKLEPKNKGGCVPSGASFLLGPLYLTPFLVSLNSDESSIPATEKYPHIMMLLPPCFTIAMLLITCWVITVFLPDVALKVLLEEFDFCLLRPENHFPQTLRVL